MTSVDHGSDTALASLTGALVDANDRLLGLLALITDDAPTSLDMAQMIDSILDRAAPILDLDMVQIDGVDEHVWGRRPPHRTEGSWTTSLEIADVGPVNIEFLRGYRRFDTGDTKLLAAVAKLVTNAVATARVHQTTLAQEVVAREHSTAAQVATAALPDRSTIPNVPSLSFFAELLPARETGGDLFTWQRVADSVWFAIGDVSGKGLPAAVLMSTAVSAVDASISRHHPHGPRAVVSAVDTWLHQRLSNAAMFVTLAIGEWNVHTRTLKIANAGHSPIVWCTEGTTARVDATAPPIGVLHGCETSHWVATTKPGDVLALATDGLTEQGDANGEMFGEDRFDETLGAIATTAVDAHEIGQDLLTRVADHGAGCVQSDDRALLVLRFS